MKKLSMHVSDAEDEVLERLATEKKMSKTQILRQALRCYQLVELRLSQGERLFFDSNGKKCEFTIL